MISAQNEKKTSIGGQALIEGIMMRGPLRSAMAVRNTEGEIVVEEWDTKHSKLPKILRMPFVRGIFNLIDSLSSGYKCLMRSAELSGLDEEEPQKGKKQDETGKETESSGFPAWMMVLVVVLALLLTVGLFIYLPAQLFSWLCAAVPMLDTPVLRSIFEGVLRIVIFVGYILAMTLMKDIRRTFMYHGAEHKTIFCYEAGLPLTVENIRNQKRFHPRCGTSFMILILLLSIIISMFIRVSNPFLRTAVKLCLIPLTFGIGYELIKLAGRHNNAFTRFISKPGVWLQHITTLEPDDSMIECAIAAMTPVIPEDRNSDNW